MGPHQLLPPGPGPASPLHQDDGPGAQQGLAGLQEQDPHPRPQADVCRGHARRSPQEGEPGAADGLGGGRGLGLHQVVLSLPILGEI